MEGETDVVPMEEEEATVEVLVVDLRTPGGGGVGK